MALEKELLDKLIEALLERALEAELTQIPSVLVLCGNKGAGHERDRWCLSAKSNASSACDRLR